MTMLRAGRSGVRILAAAGDLSLLQNVQTGARSPPSVLFNRNLALIPGVKGLGRGADYLPPASAEVNKWSYTSSPTIRLRAVYRENFTFTFWPCWLNKSYESRQMLHINERIREVRNFTEIWTKQWRVPKTS
jgi:hypothetical protein